MLRQAIVRVISNSRWVTAIMVLIVSFSITFDAPDLGVVIMLTGILIWLLAPELAILLYLPIGYLKRRERRKRPDFESTDEAELWALSHGYQIVHECDGGGGHIVAKRSSRVPFVTYTLEYTQPPSVDDLLGMGITAVGPDGAQQIESPDDLPGDLSLEDMQEQIDKTLNDE